MIESKGQVAASNEQHRLWFETGRFHIIRERSEPIPHWEVRERTDNWIFGRWRTVARYETTTGLFFGLA